jgi:DNA-binding MarR family transcriptional regulator
MRPKEIFFELWEVILMQQRKTRFITLSLGASPDQAEPGLSFSEALILLVVDADPDKNVRDLAKTLQLERSWVSRIVSAMEENGLIECSVPDNDRRSKNIRISRKGRLELSKLAEFRSRVVTETFKVLPDKEQKELRSLLKGLADGLGAPHYVTWAHAHPIDNELARISWRTGVIGESFMQSGMNVTRYQLLYELAKKGEDYSSAADLSLFIPADASTVSRTVVNLCEEGLAVRKISTSDARKQLVRISPRGKALWESVHEKAAALLQESLGQMPEKDVVQLTDLLRRAVYGPISRSKPLAAKNLEVRVISDKDVESFAVSAGGNQQRLGFFADNRLLAVMDIEQGQDRLLQTFRIEAKELESADLLQFIKTGLKVAENT